MITEDEIRDDVSRDMDEYLRDNPFIPEEIIIDIHSDEVDRRLRLHGLR